MKITIPYGNFGSVRRSYDAKEQYRGFTLFFDDEAQLWKIAGPQGYVLLRNRLNAHLPDVSPETWKQWVDWVGTLDPEMSNQIDRKPDFRGHTPNGRLKDLGLPF